MNNTFNIEKTLELSGFSRRNITDAEAIFIAAYEMLNTNASGVTLSTMKKSSAIFIKSVDLDKEKLKEISAYSVIFELFPLKMRLVVRRPQLSANKNIVQKMYLIENENEMSQIDYDEILAKLNLTEYR